jgi:3-deoxy-7-phosphoheptulonate synthase
MAVVLTYGASGRSSKVGPARRPVSPSRAPSAVRCGRVALPAYRATRSTTSRSPPRARRRPGPLLRVYNTSAATLNLLRAFTHGGYADLRQVHEWNKGFFRDSGVMRATS